MCGFDWYHILSFSIHILKFPLLDINFYELSKKVFGKEIEGKGIVFNGGLEVIEIKSREFEKFNGTLVYLNKYFEKQFWNSIEVSIHKKSTTGKFNNKHLSIHLMQLYNTKISIYT